MSIRKIYPKRGLRFRVGGIVFRSKAALGRRIKHLKGQMYAAGEVAKPGSSNYALLYDFFCYHPEADRKLEGCVAIGTRKNRMYKCIEYYIEKAGGERWDVSYKATLRGAATSHHIMLQQAFRRLIAPQITDFRRAAFGGKKKIPCALTGQLVSPGRCHVDHSEPQFVELVATFVRERNIDVSALQFKVPDDASDVGLVELHERHAAMIEDWLAYHNDHAVLRVVTIKANLTRERASYFDRT